MQTQTTLTDIEREAQLTSDRDRHTDKRSPANMRDRHRQTWTRLTDIEREAQLRSRHRLTRTKLTNIEREARLTSDRDRHRMSL